MNGLEHILSEHFFLCGILRVSKQTSKHKFVKIIQIISYSGLFVGPLCLLRSHRWTLGAGLLLMVSGVFLSAFSKSAMDLCLSVGVIVGMS